MLPKIQPALSDYYSDNAAPLSTRLFDSIWQNFNTILEASKETKSVKILDLGKAQPDSFNFYSEHNCYLTIADCIQQLTQLQWPTEDNPNLELNNELEKIIPTTDLKYDLILVWDSLNYVNPKILPFIHNHLLKFCTNKTIIHGFLFTSENYPALPGIFKILTADKIKHAVLTEEEIQHSPLTPIAINKAMPNFKYARSVLMRSGLQEFILMRK